MRKRISILVVVGFCLLPAISKASENSDVEIHGFISQGYLRTDHNNYMAETKGKGSFEFNELGLNFGTDLTDKLHIGMQFFARDLGENGNDDLVLDWAFADYRLRDWLGFRVGRIKTSFGYYNAIRDFDVLRTGVFAPQSVYPELLRDTYSFVKGVSLYGYKATGLLGNVTYNYTTGLFNISEESAYKEALNDFWSAYQLDAQKMEVGMSHVFDCQWETPVTGLTLGGTYYLTEDLYVEGPLSGWFAEDRNKITYFKENMDSHGFFLLLRYSLGNAVLMGEYWINTIEAVIDVEKTEGGDQGYLPASDLVNEGWYGSFSYRFNETFEAEYTYSVFYPDTDNRDGHAVFKESGASKQMGYANLPKIFFGEDFEAWKKTSTFSFRFDINENWLVKLEAAYNDGFGDYTFADNSEGLKRYWWLYAAKVTYNF